MKINMMLALIIIFAGFSKNLLASEPQLYSSNQRIVTFLLSQHDELADPDCLLQFIDYKQHQVFLAAGGSIDSVEVKTDIDEQSRDVWHVKLIYDLGAYQEMRCQLK